LSALQTLVRSAAKVRIEPKLPDAAKRPDFRYVPEADIRRLSEGMPEFAPFPGNIRVHYYCRSRRAEPLSGSNAPASATAAYCWKQTNLLRELQAD
jgi:hypothetical protein